MMSRSADANRSQFYIVGHEPGLYFEKGGNVYAGWSQAYRPVVFKDIIPSSKYEFG